MKKTIWIVFCFALITLIGCRVKDKRLVGVYKTSNDDTLRLADSHNFRIELTEPDTVELHQFKISTGRWSIEKRDLILHMDSRSMGQYWECQPFSIGWRRLSRPAQCEKGGSTIVFHKIKVKRKKVRKAGEEEKPEKPKKKKKEKKVKDKEEDE